MKVSDNLPTQATTRPARSSMNMYSLSGSNVRFVLPDIDSTSMFSTRTDHSTPRQLRANWACAPGQRPRCLVQLEDFVAKELRERGVEDPKPSQRRLSVFKEAFDLFIQEFSTFAPLLLRIKGEYDALLDAYASKLQYIAPLKAKLSTMKEDACVKLKHMKTKQEQEVKRLEKYAADLLRAKESAKVNFHCGKCCVATAENLLF